MPKIHGLKTYATAAVMVGLGVLFIVVASNASWSDPQGEIKTAARQVVGWVLITQGVGLASLRHAIQRLAKNIGGDD